MAELTPRRGAAGIELKQIASDMLNSRRYHTRTVLWVCLGVSLAVTLSLVFNHHNRRAQLEQTTFNQIKVESVKAAAEINRVFGSVMALTDDIVADLASGALPYADIDGRMRAELDARSGIDGIAITFEPYVYSPTLRLYQSYLSRGADDSISVLNGATYDYSQPPSDDPGGPKTGWYHTPLKNGAIWNEPFLATGAGKVLIEYGAPFLARGSTSKLGGVVTTDYSLQGMRDLMAGLQLGENGYGFVISGEGVFLSHPQSKQVAQSSLFDPKTSLYDDPVRAAARRAVNGDSVSLDHVDSVTEQDARFYFEPIPATGWALGIVLDKTEIAPDVQTTVQEQVGIALAAAATLFFAMALVFGARGRARNRPWAISIAFAALCAGVMIFTWYVATTQRPLHGIALTNGTAIDRHLERYAQSLKVSERPIVIPTGIQITAIQYPDAKSVQVNGYVWQRYPKDLPKDVNKGFRLMQSLGAGVTIDEVERVDKGDEEVIVWAFGAHLQQSFNPSRFPFDNNDIQIRISPSELDRNVVLAPDLESYELISPRLLPGLNPDVAINNWKFQSSLFSYKLANDKVNLGLPSRFERANTPELYFSINTIRAFVGPFIAYLFPGLVIAGLLFAFLLREVKVGDPLREELPKALGYCVSLFFAVAVLHTALRNNTAAVGVTYLEYIYILLYVVIIAIIVNALIVQKRPDIVLLRYNNNAFIKLLYWPTFAAVMLICTVALFVYA